MLGKSEIITILIGASPILELRGALPFAISHGFSPWQGYVLAVVGNMLPVVPLFFIFDYLFNKFKNIKYLGSLLSWWFAKIEKKSKFIQTYGFLGLIIFVAIPLPTSGAWTGTLAARLLRFNIYKTVCGVFVGVLIAGLIILFATQGVIKICFLAH
jgi:uncharacterized membrane protein